MSASATFELPADVDVQGIRDAVRRIWTDDAVHDLVEPNGRITLQLCWYVAPHDQGAELRRVVLFLLEYLGGRPLYYFRDSEGCSFDDCPDYPRGINVDELLSAEFAPRLHNGLHYRYLVVPATD